MLYACGLFLAALASASLVDDQISLLQRSTDLYRPLRKKEGADPAVLSTFHPTSVAALTAECGSLAKRFNTSSRDEALPFVKALTDAARALLALDQPEAEQACLAPITTTALFNHPFALMANRTEGSTPLETVIESARKYSDRAPLLQFFLPAITNLADPLGGTEMVEETARLGGLDAIFAAMHRFTGDDDADVLMMAWAALSDFAFSKTGAATLANHGGALQGCKFGVSQMREHPQPYFAQTALNLTLKYEILMTLNGMLTQDTDGAYSRSCVEAGILDQLLYTMRVEDGLRPSEDIGCQIMNKLLQHNASWATMFKKAGAVEAVKHALEKFGGEDNTEFLVGVTVGAWYPAGKDCQQTLSALEAV